MPATNALYDILTAQQSIDHSKAVTRDTDALAQQRMLGVLLSQQQMQREQVMREKLQSGAFSNPTSTAAGAPPAPNGNPPPATKNIFGMDFEADDPLVKSVGEAQRGIDLVNQRIALTKDAGDVRGWEKATQDHDNQQKELRLAQLDLVKEGERRNKEAAQAFGSVETIDDLKAALQYVNNSVSKKQAQAIAQQLQQALPDPANATPEQIRAAVAPITNRYTTAGDQLRFRGSMQASTDRAAALAQQKQLADARAAAKQAGSNVDLSESAINDAADIYNSTGKLPALYSDRDSKKAVMNAAAVRKEQGVTLPAAQAEYKSNALALNSLTKDIATIRPYKDMLDTNAEILKTLAQKAIATGSPFINKPINWIEQNAAGDPDMAEFLAQMHFVQSEAARVIQNPRLVGPMTDAAKQEINAVINGSMSLDQVERVVNRIQADGNNRVNAMERERGVILKGMTKRGGAAAADAQAASTAAAATTAPDVQVGRGGIRYQYVGPPGGDRSKRENWKALQ